MKKEKKQAMANNTFPKNITVSNPDKDEYLGVMGGNYRILVSGKNTNGKYTIIEMIVPPGAGPAPHSHADVHETFFMTEGELLFKTGDGHTTVKAGGFVDIPTGGAVHTFKNTSKKNAHVICTVTPAGLDEFFRELGEPVKPGQFLPLPDFTPEFFEKLSALNEKYGNITFAPNYLD